MDKIKKLVIQQEFEDLMKFVANNTAPHQLELRCFAHKCLEGRNELLQTIQNKSTKTKRFIS
ncbi:MAG TPA: hypothetical protein PLG90_04735 [Ignavibacteria bacterium]|nr:hypothetical protein [Ignavibacteria bacterium]